MALFYFFFLCAVWTLGFMDILCQEMPKLNPLSIPEQLSIDSRARILCVASSGDQPIEFEWLKDEVTFIAGKIEQLDAETSSLTIENLSLDDIGNYTCVASNESGRSRVTSTLFVTAPPQWVVEPFNLKVHAGQKAVFNCLARGSPKVKISWKRISASGNVLPLSKEFQVLENGSLTILNVKKSTSGSFMCEAVNGVGNGLRKSVEMTVYEYPAVERIVDHVTVERGQAARLSCLATGDQPLLFLWMKNHKFLNEWPENLDRFAFSDVPEINPVQFSLSISNTKFEDEGLYSCIAKNEYGSDEKDIRLLLVERPHPPNLIEIVDIWSRSVRIKWLAPNNGNSPLLSYTVEYWSSIGGHWNETVSSSSTSCILRHLKPFTTYYFHVWATNDIGDSEPSQQEQFRTAKEEPSAPPLDFKLEDVGSTFVRLSWKPPPSEDWNGPLKGYYVGYKQGSSKHPFTYNTVQAGDEDVFFVLRSLQRSTKYLITVRSFNEIGSGPSAEEIAVKTLHHEPPPQPVLVVKDIGSTYLQINWILSEEVQFHTSGYSIFYRKSGGKWQEILIPDASQVSYTLTNLDSGALYQVYIISKSVTGMSEPSEIASVRTSPEAIYYVTSRSPSLQQSVDDVTQILYIVVPVAVATVIIVIVIVSACVYVYSKRPLPPSHPYGDLPVSKQFSYMSTVPRQRDIPITVCGGNAMKFGSPYSTVPLTRPEEEEPIYESVMDEIMSKMNRTPYHEDLKMSSATIV